MEHNTAPDPHSDLDTGVVSEEARPRGGRATEIRTALQEEIETGKLPPGSPLDERALAARFQVSRTPVREALQQLAARDLVRIAPRQGMSVARLSISQVRAIMETIGELEGMCAKLAARRVDDDLRAQLDAALQHCQDAAIQGGTEEYAQANAQFHEVIYVGSRNPYLADLIRTARRQIYRYRLRDFVTKAQINKSMQDHLKVARAIQDGDELAATQQMMLHVPSGSTGFSEFLARMPMSLFDTEAGES
ncbi:MAG: GntR family transcriptional regulator [Hydrogenophaga sp.]|uniref:GntR family transcriptional regulator n=1 Tax=Hydrogenophaga sp. TaxID=1904254 RepID=UPI00261325F7|nr:GntR family transcriptional regulator [Hydrogenophaga sp.]MCW5670774.1 GntR family transcriptional regulator [Hydrogenophaga sp.]